MKYTMSLMAFILVSSVALAGTPPLNPELTPIGGSFSFPLGVRNAGDGSDRLFVIERNGVIKIIDAGGNTLPTPFLDINTLVDTFFEGGLLGLAFHPDYANNGYFYVNYTSDGTGGNSLTTNIVRYQVSAGDANVADANSAQSLLTVCQPGGNHNGGDLHFGADGYLYIPLGDGGPSPSASQEIDPTANGSSACRAMLGSVLRIDVDNPGMNTGDTCGPGVNYGIPAGNPYTGNGDAACDEIWAYGLRNPYRFSVDRDTGDLFIADVGQNSWEEVNFQDVAAVGGTNYGWPCREGLSGGSGSCRPGTTQTDPIFDYSRSGGRCSITGGYRYRGPQTTWYGTYIYADYCSGHLYYSQLDNGTWSGLDTLFAGSTNIFGFGEAEDGRLFYTTSNSVIEITDANFNDDLIFADGFQ